ncbi:MAG TPA: SH3 domain-containing protein [Spirochaetia bacterium]|nr:SH3 domain-containing protein [Spirochaetia bacterium]
MRRLWIIVLLAAGAAAAWSAPLPGNGAFVTLDNAPLYQENPDKTLKYLEGLTLGDVVTLLNRTATFKDSGTSRDYLRVRAPDGKEGWVRPQFVAPKSSLAVVVSTEAILFTEPRYVKATARYVAAGTVVAILPDGLSSGFAHVQGFDNAAQSLLGDQSWVSTDDLSAVDADVQAAILYTVAMDTKSADVRRNLLKLAASKYSASVWGPAIDMALNGGAPVPSKTLLDSGDLHVTFQAGTVARLATTHNIVQLSKGDSTSREYVDGLVIDMNAQELPLGRGKAVFVQSVVLGRDGRHASLFVYAEDDTGVSKLGGPWDVPVGAKVQAATGGAGPWPPFTVRLPDATPGSAYTAGALYATYDSDQGLYVPEDYTDGYQKTDGGLFMLNSDQVNLRDGPSPKGAVLGTLSADTQYRIVDRSPDTQTINGVTDHWYKIAPADSDKSGWIFGGSIQVQAPAGDSQDSGENGDMDSGEDGGE